MGRDEERRVASWYNALSRSYDELYTLEQSSKHDLVLELLKGTRFKTLVDIGSGTGTFLQRAKHFYEYAVGIDVSKRMLEIAKKEKPTSADLILASSLKLPVRTGSVDCTVSISAAKADEQLAEFVDEMERVSNKESVRILTILRSSNEPNAPSVSNLSFRTKISDRENLYFLGPSSVC